MYESQVGRYTVRREFGEKWPRWCNWLADRLFIWFGFVALFVGFLLMYLLFILLPAILFVEWITGNRGRWVKVKWKKTED